MKTEWKLLVVNKAASQEIFDMSADVKAKFLHISELMIKLGPINMGMPHIKHLEDKLWEIRVSGKTTIARSIYCLVIYQRTSSLPWTKHFCFFAM